MFPPTTNRAAATVAGGDINRTALCAGCRAPVSVTLEEAEGAEPVACASCAKKPKCPFCHKPMNSHEDRNGACFDCERLQRDERQLPR